MVEVGGRVTDETSVEYNDTSHDHELPPYTWNKTFVVPTHKTRQTIQDFLAEFPNRNKTDGD